MKRDPAFPFSDQRTADYANSRGFFRVAHACWRNRLGFADFLSDKYFQRNFDAGNYLQILEAKDFAPASASDSLKMLLDERPA